MSLRVLIARLLRLSLLGLTFVLTTSSLSACQSCASSAGVSAPEPDAAPDEPDSGMGMPSGRPALEDPAQIVPLLYGRRVELLHHRAGAARTRHIPLDDPSDESAQVFFADVEQACLTATRQQLSPPVNDGVTRTGCARDGIFTGMMHACRANIALSFAAEGSRAGLSLDERGALWLDLGDERDERVWTASADAPEVRASFAMLAVSELREAVRALAITFDPERCQGFDGDDAFTTRPLPDQAAEALFKSDGALEQATRLSDVWLARAMAERANDSEDSAALRVSLTRGLNGSLLERQKLFAAIPYGAFEPVEGEEETDSDRPGRYPVLYAPRSTEAAEAAQVLSLLHVSPFEADGRVASEDALLLRVFSGLRREVPLVFGGWDPARGDAALLAIDLERAEVSDGARYAVQTMRALGTPWASSHSLDGLSADGVLSVRWGGPGPTGYAFALLEGASTLASDLNDFARRGLFHARHVARTAARRALDDADLGVRARGFLMPLSDALGPSASVCRTPSEQGLSSLLQVTGLTGMRESEALGSFELWRGEAAIACALAGEVAGAACDERAGAVSATFDADEGTIRFEALRGEGEVASQRLYLTRQKLDDATVNGRAIVAAFSAEPFRAPKQESCGLLPLNAQLMSDMHAVHSASAGAFVRSAAPLRAETSFEIAADDALPLTFQRTIRLSDATEQAQLIDLSQPLRATFRDFISAVEARCDVQAPTFSGAFECSGLGAGVALREACVARELSSLVDATEMTSLGALSLLAPTEQERLALRLFSFERAELALVHVLDVIDPRRCEASDPAEDEARVALAFPVAASLLAQLTRDEPLLRAALTAERNARWDAEPDGPEKRAGALRDELSSALAEARLYVAAPRRVYGAAGSALSDSFEDALTRFPALTRPVTLAEDARIESLLRTSGLHPLVPDLALTDGTFAPDRVADALESGAFTRLLRFQLASDDPTYETLPEAPAATLAALGVSQAQLEAATLRVVELSEWRGTSLLSLPATTPTVVSGLSAPAPGAHAAPLFALSAGRLASHPAASWHHGLVQGLFHVLAHAREALAAADLRAPAQDASESNARADLLASLGQRGANVFAIERTPGPVKPSLAVELALPDGTSPADLASSLELWWTDSGMRCALSGSVAGAPCDEADYRFGTDTLSVTQLALPAPGMQQRVRMTGFTFPTPVAWDSKLTDALRRGRVYATLRTGAERRVVAALSLENGAAVLARVVMPDSSELREALTSLLGYRVAGEGCATCVPRSICETTRCELDLCVREPVADGRTCTLTGQCLAGVCDAPGCGDGARSDGTGNVPFEACDDGNLVDLDGCSASCEPGVRQIEPAIAEGWPAGPAPAIGVDSLGRSLIVYTTDALVGDDVSLRAAAFDAFGAPLGNEQTLEAQLPRGYLAEPTILGLSAGGFVVAYASPSVDGMQGVAYRFVDASGNASQAKLIEPSAAVQNQVRLAADAEGFVAVWREGGAGTGARLRMRRFDALGEPWGAGAFVAEPSSADVDQAAPSIASSLGQWLVTWSEYRSSTNAQLGVYARRFAPDGVAVDALPIAVAEGACSEPASATLSSDDYVIAFTDRRTDSAGDIATRVVRRFGPALAASAVETAVATSDAETLPVVVAAREDSIAIGYQFGAPLASARLYAPSIDAASVSKVQTNLAQADFRDLSMVADERGVWLAWSEALAQSRGLFLYRLPLESAP